MVTNAPCGHPWWPTQAGAEADLRPAYEAHRCDLCGNWHVRRREDTPT